GVQTRSRLVVASHRSLELALAHLGAASDAQAFCLAVELLLREIATTDWHLVPPFVRGTGRLAARADSQTCCMNVFVTGQAAARSSVAGRGSPRNSGKPFVAQPSTPWAGTLTDRSFRCDELASAARGGTIEVTALEGNGGREEGPGL